MASTRNGTSGHATSNNNMRCSQQRLDAASPVSESYPNLNRVEVTRLLIQALSDIGYRDAAESVSRESGCQLESPVVADLRSAILGGSWQLAEEILFGASGETNGISQQQRTGLPLIPGADETRLRFLVKRQKYLETLEQDSRTQALKVLREELTPLCRQAEVPELSSFLMYRSPEHLRASANWDGATGNSRNHLLSDLSKSISPHVILPEKRLLDLLSQITRAQVESCRYHTSSSSGTLLADHKCDKYHFPSEVAIELNDFKGEVWSIGFSHDGRKLAACGSNSEVVVWDTRNFRVIYRLGPHQKGLVTVVWSPDDAIIFTGSFDKVARLWDGRNGALIKAMESFDEPVTGCAWAADGETFVTSSLDRHRSLRTWDKDGNLIYEWSKPHRCQDISASPDGRWIVVAEDKTRIHLYNASTHQREWEMDGVQRPVVFSADSNHVLLSRGDGVIILINVHTRETVQKFVGPSRSPCLIRTAFGGADESFVVSGSESEGSVFVWHRHSGELVAKLSAHFGMCNAAAWSPSDPCMLASCGDDGLVKIWTNSPGFSDTADGLVSAD